MGRGNVCTHGVAEGLFFVDNEFLQVYRLIDDDSDEPVCVSPHEAWERERDNGEEFEYDETGSWLCYEDFKANLKAELKSKFKSLRDTDEWIDRYQHAILENDLFYIVLEDNEWSVAVELIQKEDPYSDKLLGLQLGLYQKYLSGIKNTILDLFGEVGVYQCAWTHGVERKEN